MNNLNIQDEDIEINKAAAFWFALSHIFAKENEIDLSSSLEFFGNSLMSEYNKLDILAQYIEDNKEIFPKEYEELDNIAPDKLFKTYLKDDNLDKLVRIIEFSLSNEDLKKYADENIKSVIGISKNNKHIFSRVLSAIIIFFIKNPDFSTNITQTLVNLKELFKSD